MKKFNIFVSIFALTCFLFFTSSALAKQKPAFVPGELLVQQKPWVSEDKVKSALKKHGAKIIGEIPQIKVKRIKLPEQALERVKAALENNPRFTFVEPNFLAQAVYVPNDEKYDSQWHLPKIQSPSCWDLGFGSSSEPIAIIDSGVDPDHPDLAEKLIPGKNFLDGSTDTQDVLGHGTAVSGTAATLSDNDIGVAGVAWDNPIMPLVVLSSDNWAYYSDIASAITYAADNGVRVMNISIAGSSSSYTLQNAVDYAWDKGSVIVAAAANYSTDSPYYPAACNHVVAVAATDSNDNLASFSNFGDWIDLCAPGTSILTTNDGGGYGSWAGTSFSSPLTAGVAALMFSENTDLTNTDVVNLLNGSTDDLGDPGFDSTYGYGRVNAYNAVLAAENADTEEDTTAPTVSVTSPSDGETVNGSVTIEASASDDTKVEYVEFFVDGNLAGSDSTSPYSLTWDTTNTSEGEHQLTAQAEDSAGNVGTSSAVSVYVDNETETDTTCPSVSVTSPNDGDVVSGSVTISADASDDTAVDRVEFYINGNYLGSDSASPYSLNWETSELSDGWYDLTAEAVDTSGNVGVSSVVSVEVKNTVQTDTIAPSVSLSTDKIGNPKKPKFKIDAYGSDNVGVTKMEIYLDGKLKAEEYSNSVKWMWQTDQGDAGDHTITAKAYDEAGNVGQTSVEISL